MTKDILSLRFLFSFFFLGIICGVRVCLLITWETSAIDQHGRMWQKQWANLFIYSLLISRPFKFIFAFFLNAEEKKNGFKVVFGLIYWRKNCFLDPKIKAWRYILLLWGWRLLSLDVKYVFGLQSPIMDLGLQQTVDTLQLRRKLVSPNGLLQCQWIISFSKRQWRFHWDL